METLKEFLKKKDKKTLANLAMIFLLGLIILIIYGGGLIGKTTETKNTSFSPALTEESKNTPVNYEERLEKRLEETLSQADGVGKTKVMLTLSYGKELVVAKDSTNDEENQSQTDSTGGKSVSNSISTTDKAIIITDKNGAQIPLVLKEIEPVVEGVVIIAEGGDDPYVKDKLTRTAAALLHVELYKVEVMKMKTDASQTFNISE